MSEQSMSENDKRHNFCDHCNAELNGEIVYKRFCSKKCKWTWFNNHRTLKPNVHAECEICGDKFSRWIAPSRLAKDGTPRFCNRTCAGKWRRGENHPNWVGGERKDKDGYVYVNMPNHPFANSQGCIFRHRLVMETMIGRYLEPQEVVHHKNDIPGDDRPENLQLYASNADHKRDDYLHRKIDTNGRLLPKE